MQPGGPEWSSTWSAREEYIVAKKYRKIDPRIWNDEKYYSASLSCQHLFFFILTHPQMTPVGAMRCSPGGLQDELDWEAKAFPEAFRKAFAEGQAKGFWLYDKKAKFLWVPNFIKYNHPENPNVLKSWVGCWEDLPECGYKCQLFQSLKDLAKGLPEAFQEAFRKAFPKDYAYTGTGTGTVIDSPPNPLSGGTSSEEKLKRKKRHRIDIDSIPEFWMENARQREKYSALDLDHQGEKFIGHHKAKGSRFVDWKAAWWNWLNKAIETHVDTNGVPWREVIDLYNETLPECVPVVLQAWSSQNMKQLVTRWHADPEHQCLTWWKGFFAAVRSNSYLLGENPRNWTVSLPWLLDDKGFGQVVGQWLQAANRAAIA